MRAGKKKTDSLLLLARPIQIIFRNFLAALRDEMQNLPLSDSFLPDSAKKCQEMAEKHCSPARNQQLKGKN